MLDREISRPARTLLVASLTITTLAPGVTKGETFGPKTPAACDMTAPAPLSPVSVSRSISGLLGSARVLHWSHSANPAKPVEHWPNPSRNAETTLSDAALRRRIARYQSGLDRPETASVLTSVTVAATDTADECPPLGDRLSVTD
jgi:hypothetical protein